MTDEQPGQAVNAEAVIEAYAQELARATQRALIAEAMVRDLTARLNATE